MQDQTLDGFKAYVEEVSKIGAWGGNLEVAALAAALDRPITVLHDHGATRRDPEGDHVQCTRASWSRPSSWLEQR